MMTWEQENESERKKEPQIPRNGLYRQLYFLISWLGLYENTKKNKK